MLKLSTSFSRNFSTSCQILNKYPKRSPKVTFDYLYGLSSVAAALHSKKREIKRLFIQLSTEKKTSKKKDQSLIDGIENSAKEMNVSISYADKGQLNNLSLDKPHQGVVLRVTPKDMTGIDFLSSFTENGEYEARQKLNKKELKTVAEFSFKSQHNTRFPLWVALDEVQDPQNFGSILRSAHFFGADGVCVCEKNSAPLSPAVSKVSSGAMEVMDVFSTKNLMHFLDESHKNGWDIIGASTESEAESSLTMAQTSTKPTILVLGNEGAGLRTNIKKSCNRFVRIPGNMGGEFHGSVDSLNVGVAAGILMYSFYNKTT
ncbi:RNA methyltransferase, TrmH family, group 3, partial [Sporodiniella umbellata]